MREPPEVPPRRPPGRDGTQEPSGTPPGLDGTHEHATRLPGTRSGAEGMRDPTRVLLITPPGSYRVHAYLEAARDLGLDMVVASEGEHSLVPGLDGGIRVDLGDCGAVIEQVLAVHRGRPIAAVVATDDATVEIANRAAAALGLAHNAPSAAGTARRKDLARAALAAAGLPVPAARRVDLRRPIRPQLDGIELPCVVKPLAMSASRGVIRADDIPGLEAACSSCRGDRRRRHGRCRSRRSRPASPPAVRPPKWPLPCVALRPQQSAASARAPRRTPPRVPMSITRCSSSPSCRGRRSRSKGCSRVVS